MLGGIDEIIPDRNYVNANLHAKIGVYRSNVAPEKSSPGRRRTQYIIPGIFRGMKMKFVKLAPYSVVELATMWSKSPEDVIRMAYAEEIPVKGLLREVMITTCSDAA